MTSRSARRSSACWRGSASRWTSTRSRNRSSSPRSRAAGGYDSSFYLLGWTPTTLESFNVFQYIVGCRNEKTNWGGNNVGDYCNPKVDALARQALQEPNEEKRDDDFAKGWKISIFDDVGYIPLHQQALAWGVSKTTHVIQRPDNYYIFAWATKD